MSPRVNYTPRMQTHEEAIAALTERGIPASRHAWALGDTIVVPLGHPSVQRDIVLHPSVAWLVPGESCEWKLVRIVSGESSVRSYPNLDAACRAALELAEAFALFEPCIACAAPAEVDFGEHVGASGLQYWVAHRCGECGSQTESDGRSPLPDKLRKLELKRNGAWNVSVEPPLSAAQWAAVRAALDVDLARIAELKRALPIPIFQGTLGESTRVREALVKEGIRVKLSEANADPM